MQTQTAVREAVKVTQLAICEYHRIVNNITLQPKRQRIYWHAGRGWNIGGVMYPGTGEQVIDHFDRLQRKWHQKTLDYEAGLAAATAKIATPGEAHP